MNGQAKIVEISDNQGRPKGILKKRPSGGSIHSTGAPSDYESDISFSGDPMMSRRSPGMVNGYPPRNEVTVLQMEPKRPQQQQHPSVVMKQPKFMGNGMAPQMAANSPAMHSRHNNRCNNTNGVNNLNCNSNHMQGSSITINNNSNNKHRWRPEGPR